jgi:hypothetical protein
MKVLVACESSGRVREAFRRRGHDAWSNDIEDAEDGSPFHLKMDARQALARAKWDLLIAHPPCTYICNSGAHWLGRRPGRVDQMREAAAFFRLLLDADVPRVCIENPTPTKKAGLPPYNQAIQPWWFGDDASKRTCLWLKNLPPLRATDPLVKARYANQTASGQNNLGPSADRAKERSRTYPGIANAFAEQWG